MNNIIKHVLSDNGMRLFVIFLKVEAFLDSLINYDKENIHENCLKATRQYMDEEDFTPDTVRKKSVAAAGLCAWVINIVKW